MDPPNVLERLLTYTPYKYGQLFKNFFFVGFKILKLTRLAQY